MRVVYWNNIPAPYMVDRFNALGRREVFDFEAWFNDRREPDRSWRVNERDWQFAYRYIPTLVLGGKRLHVPLPLFGPAMPDLLVSLYAEPAFVLGWIVARLRKRHVAFWAQVTNDNWVVRRPWRERFKRIMFSRVDATLGSGQQSRRFAMRYGTPANRALTLQHAIDVDHFAGGAAAAQPNRQTIRKRLGLTGTTFVYVGRLWDGKGLSYLIDAFQRVQRGSSDPVSLLIVGDGEAEEDLRALCRDHGIVNVVFAGFRDKEELPELYAASDVFVFPTLGDPYGLVVDEAMVSGLPVISTDAAGEIGQRIEHGNNGYIVSAGDPEALAEPMLELAHDECLRRAMGIRCEEKMSANTPEQWAIDFENIVSRIMSGELD